ncbi:hypothetical protein [Ktedonobacter racemifer]|uniref:Uncharacterized protein n=1 Tax=Ktedonobacter racemifer DSM 44963 TaxID=485913 RepID=D6U8U7_KTERA|nr:hypothetical protein [Ktedonobacter racemifer]EFH79657.1 hypothetical protein Krac_0135 [Ktedonobacter racemifer DSM 44963]
MLSSPLPYTIHPIVDVIHAIDQGQDPWASFNAFYHDWWGHAVAYRQELIAEPPATPTTEEGKRWAAFAAATVEELCNRHDIPCPEWTQQPFYFLAEPWYIWPQPSLHEELQKSTLAPYKRRNVYAGGNVLDNKYELKELFGPTEEAAIRQANTWILTDE